MPAIKIYLEAEELDAVERLAESLGLRTEDIAYCALNRLMLSARDAEVRNDIRQTREWRRGNLPLWSDSPQAGTLTKASQTISPSQRLSLIAQF